jgi:AcrR family transcriptional regulator
MPRRYNRSGRDAAMAQTRARIVEAVVALHAERGARATSYADIAERADVAIATVYKHLPSLETMFAACVGHVSERAPPIGPGVFDGLSDPADRLTALVKALVARHRYFEPWLRWSVHEAALIPELAVHRGRADEAQRALIVAALAPAFKDAPPPALVGLLASLFDFRAWQTLTARYGLDQAATADTIANAARLLLGGYANARPSPASGKESP